MMRQVAWWLLAFWGFTSPTLGAECTLYGAQPPTRPICAWRQAPPGEAPYVTDEPCTIAVVWFRHSDVPKLWLHGWVFARPDTLSADVPTLDFRHLEDPDCLCGLWRQFPNYVQFLDGNPCEAGIG